MMNTKNDKTYTYKDDGSANISNGRQMFKYDDKSITI